jgi:phosphatidate cytidylyltransferase
MNPSESQQTTTPATTRPKRSMSNLALRVITGLVLMPLVFILLLWGGLPLTVGVGFLMGIAVLEFYFMEVQRGLQNNALIGIVAALAVLTAFHTRQPWLWQVAVVVTVLLTFVIEFTRGRVLKDSLWRIWTTIGGIFYLAFPFSFLIAIRQVEPFGIHWVFAVIFSTWSTDTFAYVFGNMFGKTKLAPRFSPNKTVEGAIGGVIFGATLPMLVLLRVDELTWSAVILLMIAPFAAIIGDLFESAVKRFFHVKDSHVPGFNIFPGHGGVLDRVDSLIMVLICYYTYLVLAGKLTLLI